MGTQSRRAERAIWWIAVLSPSVLLRLYPSVPLASDEKVFAVASKLVSHGALMYRDVFDHKGPALYWGFNVWEWLAGGSFFGVRLSCFLASIVLQLSVYAVVRRLTGSERAGFLSALAAGVAAWVTNRIFGVELWMVPAVAAALALLVTRKGGWSALAAGILAGFAMMVKPVAVLDAAVLLLIALATPGEERRPGRALAFVVGSVAAIGFFVAPFARAGALHDFYAVLFAFNTYYSHQLPLNPSRLAELAAWLGKSALTCCFLWVPSLLMARGASERPSSDVTSPTSESRAWTRILLVWTVLGFVSSLLGRRPLNHYLLQPYLPMAILTGFWLARSAPSWQLTRRVAVPMALAWVAGVAAFGLWHLTGMRGPELGYAAAEQRLARTVDDMTQPGDPIFVWGNATDIYYFSARQPATKYIFYPPFRGAYGAAAPPFEQAYWADWTRRFDESRPAVIVDCSQTRWCDLPWLDPYRNPELAQRLERDYRMVLTEDGFRVFERKGRLISKR